MTAVLWDLDGILVDSEPVLFEAERLLLAEHGAELTAQIKREYVGLGGREVLAALAGHFGLTPDLAAWTARKIELASELLDSVRPFGPTTAMVRALSAEGVPMAVASGSPPAAIDRSLTAAGLAELLPVRVSVEQVAAGKPAPDVFLAAARRLGVPPADCVVVEDAVPGVLAARAAGMRCVAIPSITDPLDPRFEQADLLVRGGMSQADGGWLTDWVLGRAH